MSQPASVALATARTLLNDDGAQVWTDAALLPKLTEAHRELQAKLRAAAAPVTRFITESPVTANNLALDSPPTDMVEPLTLWEKSPIEFDYEYVRMTEYDPLPIVKPCARLIWWRWTLENIEFLGSIANRDVRLHYVRTIPIPAVAADPLGIIDAEFYLGPRTAALAFGATGNSQAHDWLTNMANQTLQDIIIANKGRSAATAKP